VTVNIVRAMRIVTHLPAAAIILLVRLYQVTLASLLGGQCRFQPTCSYYVIQALQRHGVLVGGWMGLRRLLRCHPFSRGGYDPVP
jgi:putative membrane protein insertion efficiency factor